MPRPLYENTSIPSHARPRQRWLILFSLGLMRLFVAFLFSLAMFGCSHVPARVAGVPKDAVWAGGLDGGAWIQCYHIVYSPDRYHCAVYFDSTGERWAEGEYVLRRATWNPQKHRADYASLTEFPADLHFSAFDGTTIFLQDSLVLIPEHGLRRHQKT